MAGKPVGGNKQTPGVSAARQAAARDRAFREPS